jgi:uncharacterized alpha-E superfamily protein
MVELPTSIVSTPAAAATAAAVTTPTVTPDAWEGLTKKIALLQEEKKRHIEMGDCVMNVNKKLEMFKSKRDELDEL